MSCARAQPLVLSLDGEHVLRSQERLQLVRDRLADHHNSTGSKTGSGWFVKRRISSVIRRPRCTALAM